MPLRLDIKREFAQRSERVKSVDFHDSEPWLLAALYNGHVCIWNYSTQTLVKSFEMCDLPLRCAKFVSRKQWIVVGADDMHLRVYNYNTMEKVKVFEAHTDYIRSIAVHPTLPCFLTSSDDMLIKLWDWEKGFQCANVYEGHSHYVMQVLFSPKDSNTFASASLDRTIKVWSILGQGVPNFTLEGHEKGVNCIDYYNSGDKPYIISGSDDRTIKIWDYTTKSCVHTLEGHSNNIATVNFHADLPIILTGSEDGTVRIWHSTMYRLETTLNYGLERVWSVATMTSSNKIAIGCDEGMVVIKMGSERPVVSMDTSGKVIWAKHHEIQTVNIRQASSTTDAPAEDGERLFMPVRDMGNCEVYAHTLIHSPNGRFVAVCGDGEYIIYTALRLQNKSFGTGFDFVWNVDSTQYAVRESSGKIVIFKNFAEHRSLRVPFLAESIHGGHFLLSLALSLYASTSGRNASSFVALMSRLPVYTGTKAGSLQP